MAKERQPEKLTVLIQSIIVSFPQNTGSVISIPGARVIIKTTREPVWAFKNVSICALLKPDIIQHDVWCAEVGRSERQLQLQKQGQSNALWIILFTQKWHFMEISFPYFEFCYNRAGSLSRVFVSLVYNYLGTTNVVSWLTLDPPGRLPTKALASVHAVVFFSLIFSKGL